MPALAKRHSYHDHEAKVRQVRATGNCHQCQTPIESHRFRSIVCQACADKRKNWNRQSGLELRPYARTRPCAKCGVLFRSDDVRSITHCPKHRAWLNYMESTLTCEEARYDTDSKTDGDLYRMTTKRFNKKQINSQDHKDIRLADMREGYKGLVFKRLTKQEIAALYTPERIAGILDAAARNWQANFHVPEVKTL